MPFLRLEQGVADRLDSFQSASGVTDVGKSQLHLIIDNYSTHKTQESIAGCYDIHAFIFISLPLAVPGSTWSSVSLLVSLQRPFAGGSFSSVRQLQAAIDAYLVEHNKAPKPFTWTASIR
jgi:hypothetical protein